MALVRSVPLEPARGKLTLGYCPAVPAIVTPDLILPAERLVRSADLYVAVVTQPVAAFDEQSARVPVTPPKVTLLRTPAALLLIVS